MDITVSNADSVIADLSGVSAKSLRACVFAMNRAIVSGQTDMARSLASDTGLKIGDIKRQMPIAQANYASPRARFGAPLDRIPLLYFKARQTRRGVSYDAGQGRKTLPGGFIATMKSKHEGVFARVPGSAMRFQKPTWKKKREAIREMWGPSLGHVFAKFRPQAIARTEEAFDKLFDHEFTRLTEKMGGSGG